ncbi:uncharacterized protein AB9X84_009540 [Acanthopagrus schlegelii]
MNTLNQQYEERVRPCIDLIDSLRSLGVERDLALPSIAVIGDQSSGKSSVLEALSGVALPRGSGIVTRCPLELKMKRKKEGEEWYGKISYQDHEEELDDPADVEKKIREAQDEMAGVGVGISDDLISLEIASPDVPDLTLIDLPGIARVAVKGQPENIGEQIKRLIQKFITRQETISLVVVPSNVDIATTEALKMAQEVDPDGERTLGILTKPDLVDKGTEETVVDIVHNEVIHLKKGYMIVKCRGQKEITERVSLTEATEREKAFFEGHLHFQTLYNDGHATVPKLAEKLTLELVHHIEKSLPRLEEQIEEKLAQTRAELERYGNGPPSDAAERVVFFIDKVTAFTQDAISLTTGEELKCGDRLNIFSTLRREFRKWIVHLDHSGEKFNERIEKEVEEYEERYRGRELPGFINYKTFEFMVKEQIKQLEEPAVKRLKDIADAVRKVFIQLAQSSFAGLPNLVKTAKAKIEAIKQEKESTAESMLRTQFKMELLVYSQDRTYSSSLSDCKREEDEEEEEREKRNSHPHLKKAPMSISQWTIGNRKDNHATLKELMLHLKSYHKIASQRLADQIPLVIRYQMLQESAIQLQREMLQVLQDKENSELLLKEDFDIGSKRAALQSRLKRLTRARAYLAEFARSSSDSGQEVSSMNTLNQQYEERVRPCIDLIDSLRSLGVERDLALPAIAVIGDQSSGKSSVLEALSGVALPRGSGIVTRCPLELKMKRKKEGEEWYGKISYQDHEEELDDPADVEKKIREAQDEMAGVGVGISDELISLEITSPDVPDLTLIDLPGIARVAVKGQPENIGEQIKRLIQKFITKQETISLVVVPSNVDIATTEALKMAQEVDPDGERTLGILTKPDLVDKGTEETVVDIVHNEVIHLKRGYMIVKCRGQKEITERVSLTEATEREKTFFEGHECFQTLYNDGHATVPKLAEKLTLELVHHIEKSLPRLEEQIEEKLAQTCAELERYGNGPPSDAAERVVFLIDKVTAFTEDAISLTTGEELKCGDRLNIFSTLRREFRKWIVHLDHSGEKFNERIEKEVEEYEERYRGRELPGFINYKTFEFMIKEQIKQLEEPAVKRLKDIADAVRKVFIQLAQSSFAGLPNLVKTAKAKIEAIKQERESTAESMLRTQFKMELLVYSQDRIYSSSLSDCKREEGEEEEDREKRKGILFTIDSHATLKELMLHLKAYYKIASQRLADQIPLVIRYQMLQESAGQLQREMLQVLQDKENSELLLKEDFEIGTKRAALQSRLKRLTQARAYLAEF